MIEVLAQAQGLKGLTFNIKLSYLRTRSGAPLLSATSRTYCPDTGILLPPWTYTARPIFGYSLFGIQKDASSVEIERHRPRSIRSSAALAYIRSDQRRRPLNPTRLLPSEFTKVRRPHHEVFVRQDGGLRGLSCCNKKPNARGYSRRVYDAIYGRQGQRRWLNYKA